MTHSADSAALDPLSVAYELFESALRLYFEGNSYFASLHLAGAAEELFGKLLRQRGWTPYLDCYQGLLMEAWHEMVTAEPSIKERASVSPKEIADIMNGPRNHVKHSALPATYGARAEALQMLFRALNNYQLLLDSGAEWRSPPLLDRLEAELIESLSAQAA
jgi:hypothetical protein